MPKAVSLSSPEPCRPNKTSTPKSYPTGGRPRPPMHRNTTPRESPIAQPTILTADVVLPQSYTDDDDVDNDMLIGKSRGNSSRREQGDASCSSSMDRSRFGSNGPQQASSNKLSNNSHHNGSAKTNSVAAVVLCVLAVVSVCVGVLISNLHAHETSSSPPPFPLAVLQSNKALAPQSDDFWYAIASGVEQARARAIPRAFVLLYESGEERAACDLVGVLGRTVSAYLTEDHEVRTPAPIELDEAELNSAALIDDYGVLIERYNDQLADNPVMVVPHLDRVPGAVAPAFHSLCDEYASVVKPSVFLFTMELGASDASAPGGTRSDFGYVEHTLRENWHLPSNVFEPLLSRLSGIILRVRGHA